MVKRICTILILLITSKISYGQEDLINSMYHQFDVPDNRESFKGYTAGSNEAKLVASVFFLFYKEFVSSQDMNVCVFTPSCSVYAMESVREYGLLVGLMNAFDRITRCHAFGGEYYRVDPETHKFYDPVEKKK
jgi:putative component of membrane protein insertase Oxa1/YidC/SpoIIIJ protein YidD